MRGDTVTLLALLFYHERERAACIDRRRYARIGDYDIATTESPTSTFLESSSYIEKDLRLLSSLPVSPSDLRPALRHYVICERLRVSHNETNRLDLTARRSSARRRSLRLPLSFSFHVFLIFFFFFILFFSSSCLSFTSLLLLILIF